MPLTVGNDGAFGGVGEAQPRARLGDRRRGDAGARLGARLGVHRRARVASVGRHAGRHGDGAHGGAAAPAGRQAVQVRLRPQLGLRRALHDAGRPALPARGEAGRAIPTIRWVGRPTRRRRRRWRCAAWPSPATRWRWSCSTSRRAPWATTSPTWCWPSIPSSWSSAGASWIRRAPPRLSASAISRSSRDTARPHLWPVQRERLRILPSTLGELSQAIGAALVALYSARS